MPDEDTGGPPARTHIRFGDLPTQVMPAGWAEQMLRDLRSTEKGRKQFGELLARAADSGGTLAPARDVTGQ
jgi:hypothetical protein